MSHDDRISNKSNNYPFENILQLRLSRRQVLVGGLAAATTGFLTSCKSGVSTDSKATGSLMHFKPVSIADGAGPMPAISSDYQYEILIPWGEPIQPDGPEYKWPPNAADQAKQIGIGHDGMTFFPMLEGKFNRQINSHGMLAINHEFGFNKHVLGKKYPDNIEDIHTAQHALGVSVVEIRKDVSTGSWHTLPSPRARRIHVNTPVKFSGPVAGHDLLKTADKNPPLGTLNNCANGFTPWGTYLTCEENFSDYFGANDKSWSPTEEQDRYGFSRKGVGYGWHKYDPRFDLSNEGTSNEENRFGWIVEIDPFDVNQTPVKRTALGRFKHEGAALTLGKDNRLVAYMGDDQRFDYIYKFVSDNNVWDMRKQGLSPLDHGTLYVAKFNEDSTGVWLPLTLDNPELAQNFEDMGELLTHTRIAADIVGATPMDRPEWTTVAPNGDVYCSLTNNHKRIKTDAANPMAPNTDGHIIKWHDSDEHIGVDFHWDIFIIAKDSHGSEESFSDPDGLLADPDGRLFIETDGKQKKGLNNQLLVADTNTGEIRRLFTGVKDAEITGLTMTPDRRTLFINIQHPGNGDPAKTNFPAPYDGKTIPRDSTIVITRRDGGIVGS